MTKQLWWQIPVAFWGVGYSAICAAVGVGCWLNKCARRGPDGASVAAEQTGAALPGWDGATISDYFVDQYDWMVIL